MSRATGLGSLDTALLLATFIECGGSEQRATTKRILQRVHAETGEDPLDSYRELTSLAQPWRTSLPLFEGHGNFGSPGNDPPADPEFTLCRLSVAGRAAVAAERGYGAPIPFGLVNGSMFRGGERPPYDPRRIAEAVTRVARGEDAHSVAGALDRPDFPGGATCFVAAHGRDGDLRKGHPAYFTCEPVMREAAAANTAGLEIVGLPPYANRDAVAVAIAEGAAKLGEASPLHCLNDRSGHGSDVRIECRARTGASLDDLRAFLLGVPGVTVHLRARLSAPAADLLAGWVSQHGREAALAGADVLRQLAEGA